MTLAAEDAGDHSDRLALLTDEAARAPGITLGAGLFLSAQALTPRHPLRSRGRLPGEAGERRVDETLAARAGL